MKIGFYNNVPLMMTCAHSIISLCNMLCFKFSIKDYEYDCMNFTCHVANNKFLKLCLYVKLFQLVFSLIDNSFAVLNLNAAIVFQNLNRQMVSSLRVRNAIQSVGSFTPFSLLVLFTNSVTNFWVRS